MEKPAESAGLASTLTSEPCKQSHQG